MTTPKKKSDSTKKATKQPGVIYTPEILIEIENAVSNGAKSTGEIAAAIGVTSRAFENHRWRKQSPAAEERAGAIERAIKRGQARRKESIKATAEDSLLKLVKGFELVDEIEEVRKTQGKRPKGWKQGDPEPKEEVTVYKRRTVKKFGPNVTAVLFALVNSDPERWKSIYSRASEDTAEADNRGTIVNWMQAQVAKGAAINSKKGL